MSHDPSGEEAESIWVSFWGNGAGSRQTQQQTFWGIKKPYSV